MMAGPFGSQGGQSDCWLSTFVSVEMLTWGPAHLSQPLRSFNAFMLWRIIGARCCFIGKRDLLKIELKWPTVLALEIMAFFYFSASLC